MVPVMLISSHAYWAWRLTPPSKARPYLVTGAISPDLPAVVLGVWFLARGVRPARLGLVIYRDSQTRRRRAHLISHSVWLPLLLLLVGGQSRKFGLGMLGHLAADFATHDRDAWPHLWPLSSRQFISPLSYRHRTRHATAFATAEAALMTNALISDTDSTRRRWGLIALYGALLPVLRARSRNR